MSESESESESVTTYTNPVKHQICAEINRQLYQQNFHLALLITKTLIVVCPLHEKNGIRVTLRTYQETCGT